MLRRDFSWDEGLDYEKTYKTLVNELKKTREQHTEIALIRRLYIVILLTQLRNGSRVGEAIDFLVHVAENFSREGYIRVEKRKDGKLRKMVLPKEVTRADILAIKGLLLDKYSRGKKSFVISVSKWARQQLGFNTHSLRYAFISYLAKKKYPAQIIAKITQHKRIDYILTYTQQKLADELLENLDKL